MLTLKKNTTIELPIQSIRTNPDQPRKVFEDKELLELRDSIEEFGVLQPIIVKKEKDGTYFLIAGERRFRAASMLGLAKIPAVIKDADERDIALIALIENVQRENLNYIEEAAAYRSLMEDHGLTQSEIAKKVGKQQSTISNKIRLLVLPLDIQLTLSHHQLSERHARALLRIEDNRVRKQILDKIINHHLNVKQTEKLIDDMLKKTDKEEKKIDRIRYINYKIYVNTIKKAFSTINDVEKEARYYQEDKGEYMEVTIQIPKHAV